MKPLSEPPSTVLSEAFKKLKGTAPSDDLIEELSKKTLLKAGEVQIWFSHLATVAENRKRGAQKASETRRSQKKKKSTVHEHEQRQELQEPQKPDVCYCGVCQTQYIEYTDEVEKWIECDSCNNWFHYNCVGLITEPNTFICPDCS